MEYVIGKRPLLAQAIVIGLLTAWLWPVHGGDAFLGGRSTGEHSFTAEMEPSSPSPLNDREMETGSQSVITDDVAGPSKTLVAGVETAIVGQFMRIRELRDAEGGALRNLEFVFRPGILPRRLFDSSNQLIVGYRQLYRNSVGYGAATVFLLYQVVSGDSDDDGQLTSRDKVDLAVSRPDGSGYRVLATSLENLVEIEHFPVDGRVDVVLIEREKRVIRSYKLTTGGNGN